MITFRFRNAMRRLCLMTALMSVFPTTFTKAQDATELKITPLPPQLIQPTAGVRVYSQPALSANLVREQSPADDSSYEEIEAAAFVDTPEGRFFLTDAGLAQIENGGAAEWLFFPDISDLPSFSLPAYAREIPVDPSGDDFESRYDELLEKKDYASLLAISVNHYQVLRNGDDWTRPTTRDAYNALFSIGNAFAHLGDLAQAEVALTWYAKVAEIHWGLADRRGGVIPIGAVADFYRTIGNSAKEMRLRQFVLQAKDYFGAEPFEVTNPDDPVAATVEFIKSEILDFAGNEQIETYQAFVDLVSATIRVGSTEEAEKMASALQEVIAAINLQDDTEGYYRGYYDRGLRVIAEWELRRGNADEAKRMVDTLMENLAAQLDQYSYPEAVIAPLGLLRARANLESGNPSAAVDELVEIMPDLSIEDTLPGRQLLLAAYLDAGDNEKARLAADELEALQTDRTRQVLAFSSEEQRIRFMKELRPGFTWLALDDHPGLARISARFKGLIFEASLEEATSHQRSTDPEIRALQEALEQAKQAAHVFKRMLEGDPETISKEVPAQYDEALAEVDRLEGQLARRIDSAGLVKSALGASPEELLKALPAGRCLIDFVQVDRYTGRNRFVPAYVAVLYHANKIEVRDCGDAEPINQEIHRLRNLISSLEGSDEELTNGLHALEQNLLGSWTSQIPAGTTLLISPDGELNFLPFAALIDEAGKMLFERYDLGIVTSARDAATTIKPWQFQSALLVGNPDYEHQIDEPTTSLPKRLSDLRLKRSVELRASSLDGLQFEPLPGAEHEVRMLAEGFNTRGISTTVLTDAEATEEAFRNAETADLIHVATHGGILPEARTGGEQDLVVGQMSSGIVTFAGANATLHAWSQGQATDSVRDGIISADEFASMDLGGVRAMVLSACDTALGASQPGEGVMGLRRGLHQAGVGDLVTTLWPISDEATVAVMESLYRRCENPSISPLKALADSQRELFSGWRSEFGLSRALYQVAPFMISIAQGREEARLESLVDEPISFSLNSSAVIDWSSQKAARMPVESSSERIRSFVQAKVESESSQDLEAILGFYAPVVDYFNEGEIELDEIAAKKQAYFDRFPTTTEEIIGDIETEKDGEIWSVAFKTAFYAADQDSIVEFEGIQVSFLQIYDDGTDHLIVREKNEVLEGVRKRNGVVDKVMGAAAEEAPAADAMPGEKYPETRTRRLTLDDVSDWSFGRVRYAINEMYARHGATFRTDELQEVFDGMSWYEPSPGLSFDEIESGYFSPVERENLKVLGAHRDRVKP